MKGILKAGPTPAKHGQIEWDEDNLGENDAYLASTTRMKIEEPKTPHHGTMGTPVVVWPGPRPAFTRTPFPSRPDLDAIGDDDEDVPRPPAKHNNRPSFDVSQAESDVEHQRILGSGADIGALADEALRRREDGEREDDAADDDAFAKRRAAHYDEFRKLKELREKGLLDDEDDEES